MLTCELLHYNFNKTDKRGEIMNTACEPAEGKNHSNNWYTCSEVYMFVERYVYTGFLWPTQLIT